MFTFTYTYTNFSVVLDVHLARIRTHQFSYSSSYCYLPGHFNYRNCAIQPHLFWASMLNIHAPLLTNTYSDKHCICASFYIFGLYTVIFFSYFASESFHCDTVNVNLGIIGIMLFVLFFQNMQNIYENNFHLTISWVFLMLCTDASKSCCDLDVEE